jgi:peptide/nickel transport system permease protein/oligopeptide transport system permease protein
VSTYVLRRLAVTIPTALAVSALAFLLLYLTPGDPALLIAGEGADEKTVELIRQDLGLDRPLPEQVIRYYSRIAQLDLGRSIRTKAPVSDQIAARLPNSLLLAGVALTVATSLGIVIGLLTALRQGSPWDLGGLGLTTVFVSAPPFWLGLLAIQLFAVNLGWLPPAGIGTPQQLILPALALAAHPLALVARLTRSEALEALTEDYVRTARSKGLRDRAVVLRHVLKNTLLPVITVIGLQLGSAFNGAVVIESVFAWPGVGRLLVESILARDFPVVQGGLLVVALGFLLTNLIVDLLYGYLDPRIRYG